MSSFVRIRKCRHRRSRSRSQDPAGDDA
jgi:hypothetical protein